MKLSIILGAYIALIFNCFSIFRPAFGYSKNGIYPIKILRSRNSHQSIKMRLENSPYSNLGLAISVDKIFNQTPNIVPLISIDSPRVMPPVPSSGGDDSKWKLWFHARDATMKNDVVNQGTGKVYYLTSDDGVNNWQVDPDSFIALKTGKEMGDWWWFDSEHVGLGDVIKPGGISIEKFQSQGSMFLMYTFGGNSDKTGQNDMKGLKMEIGVAVSQDGIHWSKVEGPSPYGSILEVGSANQYDALFLGWPCVVEAGLQYFMYYHTYSPISKRYTVGMATAADGLLKWTKRGPIFQGGADEHFDGAGVTRRHVIKLPNGSFRMWYEGVSRTGIHSIGLASSPNGIVWERVSDDPIFAPSEDPTAWDSGSVGSPHLVWIPESKRWRMYYSGVSLNDYLSNGSVDLGNVGASGIGIAESLDEEGMYFKRLNL